MPADNVNVNKQLLERRSYGSSRPVSKRSTASSRYTRKSLTRSSLRSSSSSFGPPSPYSNATAYSSPRSSLGQGSLFNLEEDEHTHWCTYGEHTNPINTCDGWKRHEKEHEIVYACMPHGPVEDVGLGPQCAFCGLRKPSPSHLQEHRAFSCVGQSKEPLKRTRKPNMVRHLVTHGISADEASTLADRWRYTPNKNAFSCGFCVKLFPSLTDRLNHIDHEHWSRGQAMSEWSLTNVIRGLLLQPNVSNAWQSLLTSHPTVLESGFSWELPTAEGLQLRLETGEESGRDLAVAAFRLRGKGSDLPRQGSVAPIAMSAEQQMEIDSQSNFQSVANAALMSTTSLAPNASFAQRSALVSRRPPVSPLSNINSSQLDLYGSQFSQPSQSIPFRTPSAVGNHPTGLTMHPAPILDAGGHMVQQPWSPFVPSTRTQTLIPGSHFNGNIDNRDQFNASEASLIGEYLNAGQALSTMFAGAAGVHQGENRPESFTDSSNDSILAFQSGNGDTSSSMHTFFTMDTHEGKPLPALPPDEFDSTPNVRMDSDFDNL